MMAGQKIKEISEQNKTKLKNINCSPHYLAHVFGSILSMAVVFNSSSDSPWDNVSMVAHINFMKADSTRLSLTPVVI